MMYIHSSATISFQPTFRSPGFSKSLQPLREAASLIPPDYREFIPAGARRRMSDVLKTAVVCAKETLVQAEIEQPDGIIVGSAHGSSNHTQRFLDKIHAAQGGLLSPTSFILSTHNTIAGQISLALGNPHYNTTYTQSSLSFEHALLDGMLHLQENKNQSLLVGAAEEGPNPLFDLSSRLNAVDIQAASGSSFFVMGTSPGPQSIYLMGMKVHSLCKNPIPHIQHFLADHKLTPDLLDMVLHSSRNASCQEFLDQLPTTCPSIFFPDLSGTYLTNSAFGLNYAIDALQQKFVKGPILLINHLLPENLGLLLVGPQSPNQ